MATSYSQDPNEPEKPKHDDGGANAENQQKAQETVAKNAAARRALPWIIAGVVVVALIALALHQSSAVKQRKLGHQQ